MSGSFCLLVELAGRLARARCLDSLFYRSNRIQASKCADQTFGSRQLACAGDRIFEITRHNRIHASRAAQQILARPANGARQLVRGQGTGALRRHANEGAAKRQYRLQHLRVRLVFQNADDEHRLAAGECLGKRISQRASPLRIVPAIHDDGKAIGSGPSFDDLETPWPRCKRYSLADRFVGNAPPARTQRFDRLERDRSILRLV